MNNIFSLTKKTKWSKFSFSLEETRRREPIEKKVTVCASRTEHEGMLQFLFVFVNFSPFFIIFLVLLIFIKAMFN